MYKNAYYSPEEFGLTMVGSFDYRNGSWEFDILALWKDAAGTLYWASDSGCSCPTPFETFQDLDQFETGTLNEFQAWAEEIITDNNSYFYRTAEENKADLLDIILRARS